MSSVELWSAEGGPTMVLDDKGGDKILIARSFSFFFSLFLFFFFSIQAGRYVGEGGEIVGHDEKDEQ